MFRLTEPRLAVAVMTNDRAGVWMFPATAASLVVVLWVMVKPPRL